MESNSYVDKTKENNITKKDLNRMAWRGLFVQASFNYERMQACGWLYSIIPGLKKIHKNKEDLSKSMKMHMEFFNTHPFLVTFIEGIVIAMEENKEDLETIRGIKIATMGPLGGIGDALIWLTLLPISAGIGSALAINGNIAGPFVFLLIFNIIHFGLIYGLMHYGYKTGVSALKTLNEDTKSISRAASILGLAVVGGLIATYIRFNLNVVINAGEAKVALQSDVLDKIMPGLLPLTYTFFMYYLLRKDKSPLMLIGLTLIIGVVGRYLNIL